MKKNNHINILVASERFPPDYSGAGLRAQRMIERMSYKYSTKFYVMCSRTFKKKQKHTNNTKKLEKSNNKQNNKYELIRFSLVSDKGVFFPIYLIMVFLKVNYALINYHKEFDKIHFFSFSWMNRIIMFSNIIFYKKKTILEITLDKSDDPISLVTNGIKNKIIKSFTKFLLKRIDKFVVLSEYSLNSCLRFGIPREKIWLRPNPCDEKIFGSIDLNKQNILRKKLNLPKDKFILLNVGIIQPRKNQIFLLKALEKLKKESIILLIIGPIQDQFKEYYNELKKYLSDNKMTDKVFFLSEVDNVNEFMIATDLFVFSSFSEGFPNTISEALTSGLPVLMTEIEKNGINKYITKENGITLKKISSDKDLVNRFASIIKDIYHEKILFDRYKIRMIGIHNFSTEKIDGEYLNLYKSENYEAST